MSSNHGAILFLTSWYPAASNPTHGIFIRNHALALSQFHKVIVVYSYSSDQKPHHKIEEKKVNDNLTEYTIRYTKPSFNLKPFSSAIQFLKMKKGHLHLIHHLQNEKCSISAIQVNVVFPVALVLDLYKKAFNVPHTVLEHWSGYLPEDGIYKGTTIKRVTEKCIAAAKRIWHVSEPQKSAMLKHGLTGNYELIYNAVDTELFKPASQSKKRIQLLHVSSLVEREKNITGTFDVIKSLQDKGYDFDFVVIGGDGEELHNAKQLANKLNLKNVVFTGVLPPSKVAELMQQSTALILFSHYEGMPVVVLEALACGLPVVATKVGQLPFMIKEQFGFLVNINSKDEAVEALENLFLNKFNFDKTAMRKFVEENASYAAVGKQMFSFYTNTKA